MTTDLAARIAASSLRPYASSLLEFVRPAIELQPVEARSADPMPLGSSHSGGVPDVGPDFEWPRARSPLSFLLQVNLAELAPLPAAVPLPPAGLLSFFYDLVRMPWGGVPRRPGAAPWRVLFTPAGAPLRRANAPHFRAERAVL